MNPHAFVPDEEPGTSAAFQLAYCVDRHDYEQRNVWRGLAPNLWERIFDTHVPLYSKEPYPYKIVLMLHQRGLALRRIVLAKLTLMKLVDATLAKCVMRYLMHPPYHLTSDYLARMQVPVGEVFISLRRWFWWYGRLPVPRCLRSLVSVDPAHMRISVVKVEREEPDAESPTRLCRQRT
jgi:hypothetical protein